MSILLPLLKGADPQRHAKAVSGLADGSLRITLTHQSDREIRAIVRHRDGQAYGVCLTDHHAFCGCPDHTWRSGVVCKHALAVAAFCLQPAPVVVEPIHLMLDDCTILCGHTLTARSRWWRRWTLNALNWSDLVCQACVRQWTNPTARPALRVAA